MNIKDFKVGQTAYLVNWNKKILYGTFEIIAEVSILSVGNKYVKIQHGNQIKTFYQNENDTLGLYLVEKTGRDRGYHLFKDKQAIAESVKLFYA